jgi:hypothetical protein
MNQPADGPHLASVPAPVPAGRVARTARGAQSVAALVLAVLGVLCLTVSPVAVWGRNLVLNTDRYVQTLKPLAQDAGVQDAVIAAVDRQVEAHIDLPELAGELLPERVAALIGPPLQSAMANLVNTVVTRFVRSDAFVSLWVNVNRTAHNQVKQVLTGSAPTGVRVDDSGVVTLNLAPIVIDVKAQLVAAGVAVAENIPVVGASIEVAQVEGLTKARKAVRLLNTVADWLPWVGLAAVALAVLAARKRRRALLGLMLGLAAGMVVLAIGLLIARNYYLDGVPSTALPRPAAESVFDTLVRFLRDGVRVILVLALLIALIAWVFGPARPAVAVRRWGASVPPALTRRLEAGPAGDLAAQHALALSLGAIAFGLLVVVFWENPSAAVLVAIALVVAVALALVELLRRGARQRTIPQGQPGP